MIDIAPVILSVIALIVSIFTAWISLFRRGRLRMTQPTVIFFGPDGKTDHNKGSPPPKVFLRMLMFATGKKGLVLESLHLKLTRNETVQNFNIWVYGDDKLVRGSGLFIGETGVATNHHFLTPKDGTDFRFIKGPYKIELFAKVLGKKKEQTLWSQIISISSDEEKELETRNAGIYFDWGPDSARYLSHVDIREKIEYPEDILKLLTGKAHKPRDDKKAS